ncbi:MAG: dihydrolipoyl dehydrogenase [Casimicrobiaceae bacterium]|nr:dihydrolipoyl dehydrogenase [Casimicrobiaceae bacterium]MDW8312800.1 dihydrolipoyl dehydrogenase [Burkholderiales bacterium]
MERFDVIVIGAGPGGYVAAIRAAQLGFKVACVDAWTNAQGAPAPGGTCTNVGCIPSKALLQSTEHYEQALHHFAEHGIITQGVSVDVATMLRRKDAVVKQNNEGILYLFKKNKVAFFHGRARFAGPASEGRYPIAISEPANTTISATHVIIATGSNARPLPGVAFDEERILSNDGALRLREVPKRLGVIGAGVIGLEMGSVWRRLGAQVTMLEALPQFLPAVDEQIAKEAWKLFTKQGLQILLGVKVEAVKANDSEVSIDYATAEGKMTSASFDRLIVAIGRVPNTEGLAPEVAGIQLDSRGFIVVDEDCRTSAPNVWAVGDVVRGPMLAHKAEDEGIAVAERIAGQKPHIDYGAIPWVIYTAPEIAWVGKTEQQLKAEGVAYRAGSFPFMANGRARALGNTEGLVKILAEAKTDRVLGMHAMGPIASELIAEGVMAIEFGASSEDIARICHAHPTLSEATREAALAVDRRALNF